MAVFFVNTTRAKFLEEYKRLYRYTSIERFVEALDSTQFTFVNPSLWSDPYEKFYLKREFLLRNKAVMMPAHDKIYAVCMSGTYESEAFWKVYAPLEDGVRLTISGRKLLENFLDKIPDSDIFIGKVNYQSKIQFFKVTPPLEKLISEFKQNVIGEEQMKLLLKKRNAFAYENELRIVVVPHCKKGDRKLLRWPCHLGDIMNDVTIDPRITRDHASLLKNFFFGEFGFTVAHSSLYAELSRRPIELR